MSRRSCVERLVSDELWELVEPLLPKAAQAQAGTDGPAAGPGSGRSGRDRVRAQDRDQLERPSRRARVRVRGHLLAAAARVAAGGGVAGAAPSDARSARPAGPAGLVAGGGGQRERAGQTPRRGSPGPRRSTAGRPAASITCCVTATGSRCMRWSPARTPTTAACWSRCWTPIPASVNVSGDRVVPVGGRASCMPTRAMTTRAAAATWPVVGSGCGSRGAGSRTPPGSGGFAGSSSARCPGCWASVAWPCATTAPSRPITALLSLACALICHRRLIQHRPRSS